MRLLIIGNATCSNRGDSAIFRGLIHEISDQRPDAELICCSRNPVPSSFVLQRPLEPDWIYESRIVSGSTLKKAKAMVGRQFANRKLLWINNSKLARKCLSAPTPAKDFQNRIKDIDAVLHVGGSFFVDLYGVGQFDTIMACAQINKLVYLAGHSMGPFRIPIVKKFASAFLPTVEKVFLREPTSMEMLEELNIDLSNVADGSDTAWLMPDAVDSQVVDAELDGCERPLIAVTVRKLAPFDKRLGITQEDYENNVADLLNNLIDQGHHVVGVSMCTGLGGYFFDDRLVAESVRKRLRNPEHMTVLWNEYNDLEVGGILRRCKMLVGTRLHSVILAMRYGTPALALYYEHKSQGVLKQLGLSQWSVRLQDVAKQETLAIAYDILEHQSACLLYTSPSPRDATLSRMPSSA